MIGVGPGKVEPEDICCIILGHPVPMILRPVDGLTTARYERRANLVDEAYVYPIMHGEASCGDHLEKQDFCTE